MTYLKRQQYVEKQYQKQGKYNECDLDSAIQNMKFVFACKDRGIDKDVILAVMMRDKK
jgi:hypothetical protein